MDILTVFQYIIETQIEFTLNQFSLVAIIPRLIKCRTCISRCPGFGLAKRTNHTPLVMAGCCLLFVVQCSVCLDSAA